ncbi:hypothetical protein OPT61_g9102 [Boeremia exigua]|uniref:Uncharacterized protein n=1 Tax=Boeremia exigua TaxID=749465 RepID=A0ACC2HWF4_9PLEO|nr:hypothetical protein OPT61_g9102 [Boeremia exigua]
MNQNSTVSHTDIHNSGVRGMHNDIYNSCQGQSYKNTPWYSDDEGLSPRASKYYSDLFAFYTEREAADEKVTSDGHAASQAANARTTSGITVFPGSAMPEIRFDDPSFIRQQPEESKPTCVAKQSFFMRFFQRAKEIYVKGPPGEAQIFWESIKSYLREKDRDVIFEICPPEQKAAAVQSSGQYHAVAGRTTESTNKRKPRHDVAVSYGNISRTSREVPIKLQKTVLNVDINKPLPPLPSSPPLHITRSQKDKGKALNVNKPLPRTPLPYSDTLKPANEDFVHCTTEPHWPLTRMQTARPEASLHQPMVPQQGQKSQQNLLLRNKAKKLSDNHKHGDGKSKPSKEERAHSALKAKISRPIAIPPAVTLSPTVIQLPSDTTVEKVQDKQRIPPSPAWLAKLAHPTLPAMHRGKNRPDSDESFACQGMNDDIEFGVYLGEGGLSVQEGGPRMRTGEEVLRPKSLFTGRDSLYDVEDEWADQRRTGRWI